MKEMREFAVKRGQAMREQAMAAAKKRNEEFIGARVPRELRDKVIKRAEDEGVSVSILVRRILEQAFNESPEASTIGHPNDSVANPAAKLAMKRKFANVLGWESIALNTQINCASCDKRLNEGDMVAVGLSLTGGSPVVLCNHCKETF
jgi:hypothetical protein